MEFTLNRRKKDRAIAAADSTKAASEDGVENMIIRGAYVNVDNGYHGQ
jgi:hypothetical protein